MYNKSSILFAFTIRDIQHTATASNPDDIKKRTVTTNLMETVHYNFPGTHTPLIPLASEFLKSQVLTVLLPVLTSQKPYISMLSLRNHFPSANSLSFSFLLSNNQLVISGSPKFTFKYITVIFLYV